MLFSVLHLLYSHTKHSIIILFLLFKYLHVQCSGLFELNLWAKHEQRTEEYNRTFKLPVDSTRLARNYFYHCKKSKNIFVCNNCAHSSKSLSFFKKHRASCKLKDRKPPGSLVYQKDEVEVYEVDGFVDKLYCYNVSKLCSFYVTSNLKLDTIPYSLHYVVYVNKKLAGCFTKAKGFGPGFDTLGILLVLPSHQGMGLGTFLLSLSYEIAKLDGNISAPERPYSRAGYKCISAYWKDQLVRTVVNNPGRKLTLKMVSQTTCIPEKSIERMIKKLLVGDRFHRQLKKSFPNGEYCGSKSPARVPTGNARISPKFTLDRNCISYTPIVQRNFDAYYYQD